MSNNVVSLQLFKETRQVEKEEVVYLARIHAMDKVELLDEMVRFQEKRSALGQLTPEMMVQGRILFRALEKSAETQELRILTRSYARHLEYELAAHLRAKGSSS